jgi:putative membrane protein
MMWHGGYGVAAGLGLIGGILILVWWILVIIGIVMFVRWVLRGGRRENGPVMRHWHGGSEKTPLDIVKERYAKGEIDKQEFEEKKKDLQPDQ